MFYHLNKKLNDFIAEKYPGTEKVTRLKVK
jgi:hypothetical protein